MSTRIERATEYYKKHGFVKTMKKTAIVVGNRFMQKRAWKYYVATEEELQAQRQVVFDRQPKLSILIPMYQTPIRFFKELMASIQGQTYSNWELCLADGSGEDTEAYQYVMELQKTDDRIKYKRLENNGGISDNTNEALDMATGDFIVLCDHDDLLTLDALYYVVQALNEDDTIDTLYTDEDKMDMTGKKFFEPSFKPDYNIDFLRGGNYICHMFVTRKVIAEIVRFKKEYDGAQDFDFIFRCCEASRKVHHIPRLLYHWRCHMNSTAANPESKMYAYEAGAKALRANLDRCGIEADVMISPYLGYYLTDYKLVGEPRVSIISTSELPQEIVDGIVYDNIERIVVEGEYNAHNINQAVKNQATGDILFFIHPKMTQIDDACFMRLLSPLQRGDLASTFAKVKNTKEILYSVGYLLGINKYFGKAFPGVEFDNNGYAMHLFVPQDMSATDLSCAMIKKEKFDNAGGMNEEMLFEFATVDLFLKMGQEGQLHMFEPRAVATIDAEVNGAYDWLKYGDADTQVLFAQTWEDKINHADPSYNPNFTQVFGGYAAKTWKEIKDEELERKN